MSKFRIKIKCDLETHERIIKIMECPFLRIKEIDCIGFTCENCKRTFIVWDVNDINPTVPVIKVRGNLEKIEDARVLFAKLGYLIKEEIV